MYNNICLLIKMTQWTERMRNYIENYTRMYKHIPCKSNCFEQILVAKVVSDLVRYTIHCIRVPVPVHLGLSTYIVHY